MQETTRHRMRAMVAILLVALSLAGIFASFAPAFAATPAGTVIHNVVQVVDDTDPAKPMVYTSNADITVVNLPTRSTVELLRYAPWYPGAEQVSITTPSDYSPSGSVAGPFTSLGAPQPIVNSGPLDLANPVPLAGAASFRENDVVFIRLTDLDQNVNRSGIESVVVTITIPGTTETEVVRLYETGPDTGVFTGYIPLGYGNPQVDNGVLNYVNAQEHIVVNYVDRTDSTDTSHANSLLDPFGVVFDSSNGARINGAQLTLIDAATSLPATVFGDDGISPYPSTVVSGSFATDSSGKVYSFGPGGYRFPFVAPGIYNLVIVPAPTYRFPTTAQLPGLQSLPGAPYVVVNPGSLGGNFTVTVAGGNVQVDVPMDPISAYIFINKTSSKSSAAIGDFVQYKITAQNTSKDYDVSNGVLIDRMPLGMRYKSGSTKLNGVKAPDPTISEDGRTLAFSVGTLNIGAPPVEVTYVVSIAVGTKPGPATNSVTATGTIVNNGRVFSNTATALVEITDDLFSDKTFIMGRVFGYGCWDGDGDGNPDPGIAGVRIYLEDGSYTITDKKGMYHFAGLKHGTHVVQLDLATIPDGYVLKQCEENTRFAGKSYSQFVDLEGRSMWRADFYLARKSQPDTVPPLKVEYNGEASFQLRSRIIVTEEEETGAPTESAGTVKYDTDITIGSAPVQNAKLIVMLVDGMSYIPGSAELNDKAIADPVITEGALIFKLGDLNQFWSGAVSFKIDVKGKRKEENLPVKAIMSFDTFTVKNQRSPVAENLLRRVLHENDRSSDEYTLYPKFAVMSAKMSAQDEAMMEILIPELMKLPLKKIEVIGHTDSTPINKKNRHIYADNYELSKARAQSIADYIRDSLGLKEEQIVVSSEGPDKPLATNKTPEGRSHNRRVELKLVLKEKDGYVLRNIVDNSGTKNTEINDVYVRGPLEFLDNTNKSITAVEGSSIAVDKKVKSDAAVKQTMPEYNAVWLDNTEPGFEWLWPFDGYYPATSSLNVAIKYDPKKKLDLTLNGEPVEPLRYEGLIKSSDGLKGVSSWRGVDLKEGDNKFIAIETENGVEISRIEKIFHYSGVPTKAVVIASQTRLVADGRIAPTVAIRLLDKDGHPARLGSLGEYSINPPYESFKKFEELQGDPLSASRSDVETYLIGENGMVFIRLKPTITSGEAVVRLKLAAGVETLKLWVEPDDRDWIIAGLGEGTIGYNVISGNMTSLKDSEKDDKLYENGRLAFFAKGKVLGKWLLTIGYDSDKPWSNGPRGLYQTIAPDKYYTLYGDGGNVGYETQSARPLYIKIEREHFYALFGDFESNLSVTELSRYNRSLNGVKSEYKSDDIDVNVFASANNQAFVKDELSGDGTSGLYRLSKRNIVMNSETIVIETRDRFRSDVIISTKTLTRYMDYSIDYESGEIFFKFPVSPTDSAFNPNIIVVHYESFDSTVLSTTAGGRAAVRMLDKKVELGATFVNENSGTKTGDLIGMDAAIKLADKTKFKAETALTHSSMSGVQKNGNGYLAELSHQIDNAEAKIYVREQTQEFGLGQERTTEAGTRKFGFDGTYSPAQAWSIAGTVYRQYKLDTVEARDMAEARIRYSKDNYEVFGGLRHAEEVDLNSRITNSEQLIAGGKYGLYNNKLTLRAEHDQSITHGNSYLYPTKTIVGADLQLNDTTSTFVEEEISQWTDGYTSRTSIGLKSAPWTGGQVTASLGEQVDENGARLFASNGLKQTWKINDTWKADAGIDNSTTVNHNGASANTAMPGAYSTDFTAASVGLAYRMSSKWSWNARYEFRHSAPENKQGVYTGFVGEATEGVGIAAGLIGFVTDTPNGMERDNIDLRLSFAYRPKKTMWILLDRLDYMIEDQRHTDYQYSNWRMVNNLNLNYKVTRSHEVSFQYGLKYVKETIDFYDYTGYTDLIGMELRYDVKKDWDIGFRILLLHSWSEGQFKYSSGPSIGYNIKENFWISLGYNVIGFKDRDFSKADFTAAGPYIKLRIKFDHESAREAVKWFSGQ